MNWNICWINFEEHLFVALGAGRFKSVTRQTNILVVQHFSVRNVFLIIPVSSCWCSNYNFRPKGVLTKPSEINPVFAYHFISLKTDLMNTAKTTIWIYFVLFVNYLISRLKSTRSSWMMKETYRKTGFFVLLYS